MTHAHENIKADEQNQQVQYRLIILCWLEVENAKPYKFMHAFRILSKAIKQLHQTKNGSK